MSLLFVPDSIGRNGHSPNLNIQEKETPPEVTANLHPH